MLTKRLPLNFEIFIEITIFLKFQYNASRMLLQKHITLELSLTVQFWFHHNFRNLILYWYILIIYIYIILEKLSPFFFKFIMHNLWFPIFFSWDRIILIVLIRRHSSINIIFNERLIWLNTICVKRVWRGQLWF